MLSGVIWIKRGSGPSNPDLISRAIFRKAWRPLQCLKRGNPRNGATLVTPAILQFPPNFELRILSEMASPRCSFGRRVPSVTIENALTHKAASLSVRRRNGGQRQPLEVGPSTTEVTAGSSSLGTRHWLGGAKHADPRPNDQPASGWKVLAGLVVGVGIAQVLALAGEGFPGVPGPDPG